MHANIFLKVMVIICCVVNIMAINVNLMFTLCIIYCMLLTMHEMYNLANRQL